LSENKGSVALSLLEVVLHDTIATAKPMSNLNSSDRKTEAAIEYLSCGATLRDRCETMLVTVVNKTSTAKLAHFRKLSSASSSSMMELRATPARTDDPSVLGATS